MYVVHAKVGEVDDHEVHARYLWRTCTIILYRRIARFWGLFIMELSERGSIMKEHRFQSVFGDEI